MFKRLICPYCPHIIKTKMPLILTHPYRHFPNPFHHLHRISKDFGHLSFFLDPLPFAGLSSSSGSPFLDLSRKLASSLKRQRPSICMSCILKTPFFFRSIQHQPLPKPTHYVITHHHNHAPSNPSPQRLTP